MTVVQELVSAVVAVTIVEGLFEIVRRLYLRYLSRRVRDESIDWGMRMQKAAEAHLDAVTEAYWQEEEGGTDVHSPSVGPYCGCNTCLVREVLAGAWPVMAEMLERPDKCGPDLHLAQGVNHG